MAAKVAARYVSKAKNEAVRFTFSKNSKDRLDFSGWNSTFDSKRRRPHRSARSARTCTTSTSVAVGITARLTPSVATVLCESTGPTTGMTRVHRCRMMVIDIDAKGRDAMKVRQTAAGAVTAAMLVLATACSGGAKGTQVPGTSTGSSTPGTATAASAEQSPATVLAQAQANARAARSGAFEGAIADQGEQAQVSFKGTTDGSRVDVTNAAPKAGQVHLISLDGSVYVKADKTFWSQQNVPFLVSLAGAKFIKVPAGVVPVLDQLTLAAFVGKSIGSYSAGDLPSPVTSETVDGIDCWVLTTSSGKPADGALYISKSALEVVRFVGTAENPGRLDFSRWNQKQGVSAPPPDQVFSIG